MLVAVREALKHYEFSRPGTGRNSSKENRLSSCRKKKIFSFPPQVIEGISD